MDWIGENFGEGAAVVGALASGSSLGAEVASEGRSVSSH